MRAKAARTLRVMAQVEVARSPDGSVPTVAVRRDTEATRRALEEQLRAAVGERDRAHAMLGNDGFTSRAPAQVVDAERAKADRYSAEAEELERRLAELG